MFSKRLLKLVFATALALSTAACGLKVGEYRAASSGFSFGDTACMEGGTQTLVDFLNGKADQQKIGGLWDCAERSLALFKERTRGKVAGQYSGLELKNFMEVYFLRETKITSGMLAELMELKRTFIGGNTDQVTAEELERIREIFRVIREQSVRLVPYLPMTPEHYAQLDEETVNAGVLALEAAAHAIGSVLKAPDHSYSFDHLEALLREFEGTAVRSSDSIRAFRANLPLIRRLKAIVISPDSERIAGNEWEDVLVGSSRWIGALLRHAHVREHYPNLLFAANGQPSARGKLVEIARDILTLIDQSIARRENGMISFDEFDAVIDSLDESIFRVGEKTITPKHVKGVIRVIVRRALGGAQRGPEGRDAMGLTSAALQRASTMMEEWSEAQRYIDALFEKLSSQSDLTGGEAQSFTRSELLSLSISEVLEVDREQISPVTLAAASRVRLIISTSRALFREAGQELYFGPSGAEPAFSYHALTQLNYMDLLGHLMVSAYAEDPARAKNKITVEEVDRFYWDFRDIGIELRIFDPKGVNIALKRFQESDLFMYDSNGDGFMNVNETTQILAFMISAKRTTMRVHPVLARICAKTTGKELPMDFFGFKYIDAVCFRELMISRFEQVWVNMPNLAQHFRGLNKERKMEFLRDLEDSARAKGASDDPVSSADSDAMNGMAQYIESIFARYDLDESNTIDLQESITGQGAAYNVFRDALKKAAAKEKLTEDEDLKILFNFLLANGHVPSKWEFAKYKYFGKADLKFQADRGRMIRILAELARRIRTNAPSLR